MKGYLVVLITIPPELAQEFARELVERKLGACVNISEVNSLYWWKGKVEESKERLLIIKTKVELFKDILKFVKEKHPYSVAEVIGLPVVVGNEDYLSWIDESL